MSEYDDMVEMIPNLKLQLIKEIYESYGEDLGPVNNEIDYKNYLINNPPTVFNGYDSDVDDVGDPLIASGQSKANGLKVIESLMSLLGLTKEQAAGIAGVLTSESGVNPNIVNKGEKLGTYKSSSANNEGTPYGTKHSPWSYGAGICQWTFCDRKENVIMGGLNVTRERAKEIIINGGIESLSLDDQIKMLAYELKTTYKATLEGIKKCKKPEESAATFYCHNVAGFSTSTNIATQAEIDNANKKYESIGAQSQITKGMKYALGYVI